MPFIRLRKPASIPSLLNFFFFLNQERVLDFDRCFFVSVEMIMWFSPFSLKILCVTLIVLHVLNQLCIPEINLACLTVYKEENQDA